MMPPYYKIFCIGLTPDARQIKTDAQLPAAQRISAEIRFYFSQESQ